MGITRSDYYRQARDGGPDIKSTKIEQFAKRLTEDGGALLSVFHDQSPTDSAHYAALGIVLRVASHRSRYRASLVCRSEEIFGVNAFDSQVLFENLGVRGWKWKNMGNTIGMC